MEWFNHLSPFLTAVATVAIAFVAYRQMEISKRQTDILAKQMDLQSAQYQPDVELTNFSTIPDDDRHFSFDVILQNNRKNSIIITDMILKMENIKEVSFAGIISEDSITRKDGILGNMNKTIYSVKSGEHFFSSKVNVYLTKPLNDSKGDCIEIQLLFKNATADARSEIIFFRFEAEDVIALSEDVKRYKKAHQSMDGYIPLHVPVTITRKDEN
jgi:hypothetical protein